MILHQITNSYGNYNYNAYIYTEISWDLHFHGNYELIYVIDGNITITVNGIRDTLSQGELILIHPYNIHSLEVKDGNRTWVGVFSQDFISAFAKENKNIRYSKFKCDKSIEAILKEYLFTEKQPEHYLHISTLYMVCNECKKNALAYESKHENEFIKKVVDYISENLSTDISLKEIANKLNYEYHYFSALFHRCFNMNFKSFVNMFRFENACKLISETDMDFTQICNECGFGSIRNFNRVFKNNGYTPSEYRNLTRKED